MKSQELRKKFFNFFVSRGHERVTSSSLIPAGDPTLLFANAGMNQFKDVFLGRETRSYKKAVSIQKCVRAGGKHNDLDNVGFTQRHLTFFEMMGNFSFGDYFKKEAIQYAWDFLTIEAGFPAKDLYVSVHVSDDESFEIWNKQVGVPKEKIFRLGADNFWQMGDTGPCGPCTEIFVDRGPSFGCGKSDCALPCGCDRFIEVWNNVFMQFDRQADGTDVALKQTGVDTGMGLERLCMLIQKSESVFDTDLFRPIFDKIESLTGHNYHDASLEIKAAFNVLGDHIRSSTFLISDGCAPANDGRGYVLRKIIRRAALFTQKLTNKNIFPELSLIVIDYMKDQYPDIAVQKDRIVAVLKAEIERFWENLVRGKKILQEYMQLAKNKQIDGKQAFMLYDTYGFPYEVTELIAREQGFNVDKNGFEAYMEEQRQRSGKKMKEAGSILRFDDSFLGPLGKSKKLEIVYGSSGELQTHFTGYTSLQELGQVLFLVQDDEIVESIKEGEECWFVPNKTPFYVECGGQVNDEGTIVVGGISTPLLDLKKQDGLILVKIQAPKDIEIGDDILMQVDKRSRLHTMKNHTATHLLQGALQQLFGKQVKQAGSVVTKDYLRFDYTYHQPLTAEQIKAVEDLVNEKIWENIPVLVKHMTYKQAVDQGIIAFFGDKYNPEDVRAIIIGEYSKELCGGTHVSATGDIGMFKIVEEVALAAGQRRMVAYTGGKALEEFQQDFSLVKQLCQNLKVKPELILQTVNGLQNKIRDDQKEIKELKREQWVHQVADWISAVSMIGDMPYGYITLQGCQPDELREIGSLLQQKKPGFYFLIQTLDNKTMFLATLDKSYTQKIDMQKLKIFLQTECGLQGGGNQTSLQGGGLAVKNYKEKIYEWLNAL